MVFDVLENAEQYYCFGRLYRKAFEWLKETDILSLSLGRHDIEGDDLYALVQEYETRTVDTCEMETHIKYIDIHYIAQGYEYIAYADRSKMYPATHIGREIPDTVLYEKEYNNKIFMEKGDIMICFLNDAHMPRRIALNKVLVRKVIIKLRATAAQ